MVGDGDLADGRQVGQQHRQGRLHLLKKLICFVDGAGSVSQHSTNRRIVGSDLPGDAGEAARPGAQRIGGGKLAVQQRAAVVEQGTNLLRHGLEVV